MPEPKSYAKRLVKGSAIVFTSFIASEVVGVFMRMFLARSLTVVEYGLFYAIFAFVSLFALFRDLGLNAALAKYIPEFAVRGQFTKIKSAIASALLFQATPALIISITLFIFSDHIALGFFKTLDASLPIRILSVWFFFEIFRLLASGMSQSFQNMPVYAALDFFNVLLLFSLAICFVGILGLGLNGIALAYPLTVILIGFFGITFFIKRYPHVFRKKASVSKPLLKKLLIFSTPIFIAGFGGAIIYYIDTITITAFRTLSEVGFYQAALPAARLVQYIPSALTVVLFPMMSEIWARRNQKLLKNMLHFIIKFSFIIIMPATFILIAFPNILINLLFGPNYLVGATALQILGVGTIVYTLYAIFTTVMPAIDRPIIVTKVMTFMACFNLIGDLALVPIYGIEGAAVATVGSFLFGVVLLIYYARKFIKFTIPIVPLLKASVGGILTLLLIFGLKSILVLPPWPLAFAVMIPGLLFYGIWILAIKAITKDELNLIAKIVPMPKWFVRAARKIVRA